jgi:hypothetical protein
MTQLVIEVPDDKAKQLAARAKAQGLPLEQYVAQLLSEGTWVHPGWPEGHFERVVGAWQGEPLERAPQGESEEREPLF